ncbi:MAG: hypothetical protein ACOCUH_03255 [Bacteriovoracia bacterium]
MYFFRMLVIPILVTLGVILTNTVQAQDYQGKPMIEIGAGAFSNNAEQIEALIKVEVDYTLRSNYSSTYLILAKMNAQGLANGDLSQIDFELNALGAGVGQDLEDFLKYHDVQGGATWLEATALNMRYSRNLDLDVNRHLRISLVGLRAGAAYGHSDDVQFMVETAVDMVTLAVGTQRASDGAQITPRREGKRAGAYASIEAAVRLYKKFRIALGFNIDRTNANGHTYQTGGMICDTEEYYDSWGHRRSRTHCYPEESTDYTEHWQQTETYLKLVYEITDRLSIMGKAGIKVFKVRDEVDNVTDSRQTNFNLLFSVNYRF